MKTLVRRVASPGAEDRGAALMVALMVIMMVTLVSIVGLGVIIAQADRTVFTENRADTLVGAESGLDVAMATFKTAVTDSKGDRTRLPCQMMVQTDRGSFTVDVGYYLTNPGPQTAAWRADSANKIPCAENQGPLQTPYFALLNATTVGASGDVGVGDRSLETTFQFTVQSQVNVPGGFIRNYNDGAAGTLVLCFDAGSAAPSAGTQLRMQDCLAEDDPNVVRQKFSYRPDYRIALTATETAQGVGGMCVTAAQPTSTTNATFQPCDTARVDQLWSYNDNAGLQGENADGQSLGAWCLAFATDNTRGSAVVAKTSSSGGCGDYQRYRTWRPNEDVGAAAAGDPSKLPNAASLVFTQLVNYLEFGRCWDITGQNVNASFMIAFPCKMDASVRVTNLTTTSGSTSATVASTTAINRGMRVISPNVPAGAYITAISGSTITLSSPATASGTSAGRFPVLPAFNQLLSYEPKTATAGWLTTTNGSGSKVCIQSRSGGGYVTTPTCSSATTQLWTVNRDVGDPVRNYTIVDNAGLCLGLGPPGSTTAPLNQWSTIVAETCNPAGLVLGSLDQKWNAPPGLASGQRLDVNEVPPAP